MFRLIRISDRRPQTMACFLFLAVTPCAMPYPLCDLLEWLPLVLFMALNTKIRDCWEGNQIPVSRSMRHMATQALHSNVLISCVDHLLSHRVVRMFRPIVAILAEFGHGRLFQKENTIRRMRSMAGIATSLLNRIMCHRPLDDSPF